MSSKLPFASDYMHLCHPAILERMAATARFAKPAVRPKPKFIFS